MRELCLVLIDPLRSQLVYVTILITFKKHIGLGNTNHVPKNHDVNSYLMQHIEAKTPDEGHDRTDLTKYAT